MWIYQWLEDQSRLIGRYWLLIYWDGDLLYQITRYELIFDVHDDYWNNELADSLVLYSVQVWDFETVLYEIVYWLEVSRLLLYYFILLKVTGKRSFDCNTLYSPIVHRIHSYCYRSLLLISFTVYTITDWLLLYSYRYCHRIVPVL